MLTSFLVLERPLLLLELYEDGQRRGQWNAYPALKFRMAGGWTVGFCEEGGLEGVDCTDDYITEPLMEALNEGEFEAKPMVDLNVLGLPTPRGKPLPKNSTASYERGGETKTQNYGGVGDFGAGSPTKLNEVFRKKQRAADQARKSARGAKKAPDWLSTDLINSVADRLDAGRSGRRSIAAKKSSARTKKPTASAQATGEVNKPTTSAHAKKTAAKKPTASTQAPKKLAVSAPAKRPATKKNATLADTKRHTAKRSVASARASKKAAEAEQGPRTEACRVRVVGVPSDDSSARRSARKTHRRRARAPTASQNFPMS